MKNFKTETEFLAYIKFIASENRLVFLESVFSIRNKKDEFVFISNHYPMERIETEDYITNISLN